MWDDLTARPYLLKAVYQWCVDMKNTPLLLASQEDTNEPTQTVFNISPLAVRGLVINQTGVFFTARFRGQTKEIQVSLSDVIGIYSRELGKGVSFPTVRLADGKADDNLPSQGCSSESENTRPLFHVVE